MAVKAVELARKIRDKHYEDTKGLSVEEQIQFIKKKSKDLKEQLKKRQTLPPINPRVYTIF